MVQHPTLWWWALALKMASYSSRLAVGIKDGCVQQTTMVIEDAKSKSRGRGRDGRHWRGIRAGGFGMTSSKMAARPYVHAQPAAIRKGNDSKMRDQMRTIKSCQDAVIFIATHPNNGLFHNHLLLPLLTFYLGESGSIPSEVVPEFSHVGIVPEDDAGLRVFSRPCIPALLHTRFTSPSQDLNVLTAAQISPLHCPPPSLTVDQRTSSGREVTSGKEVCDCEYQAVKDAAGRRDYWTRCSRNPHLLLSTIKMATCHALMSFQLSVTPPSSPTYPQSNQPVTLALQSSDARRLHLLVVASSPVVSMLPHAWRYCHQRLGSRHRGTPWLIADMAHKFLHTSHPVEGGRAKNQKIHAVTIHDIQASKGESGTTPNSLIADCVCVTMRSICNYAFAFCSYQ
ncbi:hypothetical protein PR048_016984 [Dryococelus australis]|uniref:Uncharacterized protein n=1 Tax=Dryococelus australis TaxID=614101 RepID=A0ABQ9H8B6_9NEOP|nr:hypothetical protein PR048_016984 [Dryococelus australis]